MMEFLTSACEQVTSSNEAMAALVLLIIGVIYGLFLRKALKNDRTQQPQPALQKTTVANNAAAMPASTPILPKQNRLMMPAKATYRTTSDTTS